MMRFYTLGHYWTPDNQLIVNGEVIARIAREEVDGLLVWVGYIGNQRINAVGRFFADEVVHELERRVLGGNGYQPPPT